MNDTADKARDLRQVAHDRLAHLIEEVKVEATRIQVCDEILGETTLEGSLPGPFLSSSSGGRTPALPSSTTPPSSPSTSRRTKSKPGRPPKTRGGSSSGGGKPRVKKNRGKVDGRSVFARGKKTGKKSKTAPTSTKRASGGSLPPVVKQVLEANPAAWLTSKQLVEVSKEMELATTKRGYMTAVLTRLRKEGTSWLRAHVRGKRAWFSLDPTEGGTAPAHPPQAGGRG